MTGPAPSDKRNRASALLMVLAVLALFSILGATLAMLARLDQKAGSNFNDTQTAEDFIPDPGLDFIVSLLQGTDEQLPDDQALYDAIDAQHLWLAGVRYDSGSSTLLREISFRSNNGDPPQFNVLGRGRIYDGIHGSDIDQDGIQDAADFGRVAPMDAGNQLWYRVESVRRRVGPGRDRTRIVLAEPLRGTAVLPVSPTAIEVSEDLVYTLDTVIVATP